MVRANDDIRSDLEHLKADYAAVQGAAFQHFYCPILLQDQESELCMGHVVNQCIPNSCRTRIVQRKDVDNFFGSLFESKFGIVMAAKPKSCDDALSNDKLRRNMQFKVKVAGEEVPHYEVRGHKSPLDPSVRIETAPGKILNLALKSSDEQLSTVGRLEIEMDIDVLPEGVATLLKSAHLTLFKLLGYNHVFSPGGYDLAKILQRFYLQYKDQPRPERTMAGREYFRALSGMIIPVGFDSNRVRGTIEDGRLMVCIGSSGAWFAVGVFIRMGDEMFVVLLAPDRAESMDTYNSFVNTADKPRFKCKLIEFSPPTMDEPACWKMDRTEPFSLIPGLSG